MNKFVHNTNDKICEKKLIAPDTADKILEVDYNTTTRCHEVEISAKKITGNFNI